MKNFIEHDKWKVIEKGWNPENRLVSESLFSVGNGYMGVRGNFCEPFSGSTLSGSYLAGIYYPDKTRVGWWKNGYPEYFAKVPNAVRWIGVEVWVNDVLIDLNTCHVVDHELVLEMDKGIFRRRTTVEIQDLGSLMIESERFCSMTNKELAFLRYKVTSGTLKGSVRLASTLDFNVQNSDSNYDENFWENLDQGLEQKYQWVSAETKKTGFHVMAGMTTSFWHNEISKPSHAKEDKGQVCCEVQSDVVPGDIIHLEKHVCITHSMYVPKEEMPAFISGQLESCRAAYDSFKTKHITYWTSKWNESDIVIDGDIGAQQGIRYNIFQLHQTYTGEDARLNIGPKGLTGEKYGGSTYWDTEAYCLPFYLGTASEDVSRNLLMYRYRHLEKAIKNAEQLGFNNGAALYPMVTMNGEECHNEWEITFEEIHRNGAIAYAIYNYIEYTGDRNYLLPYGLEVLVAVSRFWAQRVNYSEEKKAFVMLGVTGPNEYENNVNNNWYTNYIARWTLNYTCRCLEEMLSTNFADTTSLMEKIKVHDGEISRWKEIASNIFLPKDESLEIFLQQDGFMDKVIQPVDQIEDGQRPICQFWSWDRILRSCYIKQADVLQGLYFFEDDFSRGVIERNFDFYEPLTVHESSLSPSVHAILAASLGKTEKAYEMYMRTARLDLDDYNNDTEDGLHITSMAGTWMALIQGMAGMRVRKDVVQLHPFLPKQWESLEFRMRFRDNVISIFFDQEHVVIENLQGPAMTMYIYNNRIHVESNNKKQIANEHSNALSN